MANSSAATSDRAPKPPKPVILLGLGAVGRSLLRQIEEQRPLLEREYDLRIAWLALSDSSGAVAPPGSGFNGELLGEILQLKENGGALASHSRGRAYTSPAALVEDAGRPGAVVVDCTASDETLDALFLALERGYQVVLANKKPLTAAQEVYDRLNRVGGAASATRSLAALRYETTVGAGLPVIATLDRLVSSGDRIERIAGSFSGTLGFLMTGLEQGRSYSETVQEAYRLGYTEPDPRDDLGGVDVARKALILARGIGWRIEMAQVQVSGLYPDLLAGLGVDDFLSALPSLDEEYRQQVARAASEGKVLRYAATLADGACSVGLTAVV